MSSGIFLKQMGAKIKSHREAKKLSQKQLALMCHLDPGSFWRIEVGQKNCYVLTLKRIATALEVEVKELL